MVPKHAGILEQVGTMSGKSRFDKAVEKAAKIIQAQLDTLPADLAKSKRQELSRLALSASRAVKNGKRSPLRQTSAIRPSSRSRAKTA
jgi:hypothetical protein